MEYFKRNLEPYLEKTVKTRPLVYLNGPRQCGKSTLVKNVRFNGANYLSFDSPVNAAAAKSDPAHFIQSLPKGCLNIIDEIQAVPEVLPWLKIAIDESRNKGKGTGPYLLTGSANLMALPRLSEALTGRMSILTLLPFSASEYQRTGVNFIKKLFEEKLEYQNCRSFDLLNIILNAGFPEPSLNSAIDRTQWFDDYLNTLLLRDIRSAADIRNPSKIIMLLSFLAMRAGGLLNNSLTAQETGLNIKTYEHYKTAALNTFIIFEIPAWAKPNRLNKRFTRSSKLFFSDTNLLAYLLRRDPEEIYHEDRITMGRLFENFIAAEIAKNAIPGLEVSHFRTQDQKEVDFVLEKGGSVIGIEVKLESAPDKRDFGGLRVLKEAVGNRFKRGVLIYPGKELVPFGDEFWAVPVSCLF